MAFVTCPFLLPSSVRTHLSFPLSKAKAMGPRAYVWPARVLGFFFLQGIVFA